MLAAYSPVAAKLTLPAPVTAAPSPISATAWFSGAKVSATLAPIPKSLPLAPPASVGPASVVHCERFSARTLTPLELSVTLAPLSIRATLRFTGTKFNPSAPATPTSAAPAPLEAFASNSWTLFPATSVTNASSTRSPATTVAPAPISASFTLSTRFNATATATPTSRFIGSTASASATAFPSV